VSTEDEVKDIIWGLNSGASELGRIRDDPASSENELAIMNRLMVIDDALVKLAQKLDQLHRELRKR
jgi:hypothetical protein